MHTNDFVSSKQHISMIYSNSRDANGNIMIILSNLIGKLHLCMNRCVLFRGLFVVAQIKWVLNQMGLHYFYVITCYWCLALWIRKLGIIRYKVMSAFCNIYIKLSLTLIIYFPELLNEHGIICNNGNNSP